MTNSTQNKPAPKEETLNFLRRFAREYRPDNKPETFVMGLFDHKTTAEC